MSKLRPNIEARKTPMELPARGVTLEEALEALDGLERAWQRFGPALVTLSGRPTSHDLALTVLKKAGRR